MALKDWKLRAKEDSWMAWQTEGFGSTDLRIEFPAKKGSFTYNQWHKEKDPNYKKYTFFIVQIWTDYVPQTLAKTKSRSKAMKVAQAYMRKNGPGSKRRTRKQHVAWEGFR